jgi:tetratricopeptide (TPR) repeat protein
MGALLDALVWDPVARRKRALLGFAGLAALGAVGVSYGVWADARAQRCGGATTKLAGIWNEGTRARVRSAFEAVETAYASRAWTRTEAALDVYADEWSAMYTEACEATTVRGEQSPATMDLRMACLQSAVVELNAAVEVLADADAAVVQQAHEVTGGLPPVDRCADTKALGADVEPPLEHEAEAVDKARAHLARARSLIEVGRLAPAGLAVQAAKDSLTDVEYEPVQAEIALVEGNVLEGLGNYEAAEAVLDESLRLATKWMRRELMQQAASHLMFVVGFQQRRTADALALRSLAAGLSEGDPMAEAHFRNSLSNILSAQGKYAESETECRAALALVESTLGPKSLDAATARDNLGAVLGHQGKHAAAEAEHRAALDVMVALLGHDHPSVAQSRNNLAAALFSQGKNAEAEREFRATVSAAEVLLGGQHPHVASTRNNLGAVLLAQGKYAEAEAEFRAALAIRVAALGHGHPAIAQSRNNLASSLADQGKFDEAETIHRATLAEREASLGHDHPDVAVSRNNLGNLLQRQGRYAEAESEFRSALGVREAVLGPEHPDVAQSAYNLATVVVQLERDIEALPLAEQAWTRRQRDDIPQRQRADSAFLLARLLWTIEGRARDRPRARQLAKDAVRWYEQGGERDRSKLADAEKWLEENMP